MYYYTYKITTSLALVIAARSSTRSGHPADRADASGPPAPTPRRDLWITIITHVLQYIIQIFYEAYAAGLHAEGYRPGIV
jgi:hypothetical protein